MKNLHQDLKQDLDLQFLLTKNFNQDLAENSFGMIKYFGRTSDNPTAYEAKHRLKTLMLGWNQKENTSFMPTQWEDPNQPITFLSTMLLNSAYKNTQCTDAGNATEVLSEGVYEEGLIVWPAEEDLTSHNFPDFFNALGRSEKSQFCGFEYICGFISMKLARKFPELQLGRTSEVFRNPQTWTQLKSSGSLTLPNYNWLNWAKRLEVEFRKFHNVGRHKVNLGIGAIKGFSKMLIRKYPEVPAEAVTFFVRLRTYIRIKHINSNIIRFRSKKGKQFAAADCPYQLRNRK